MEIVKSAIVLTLCVILLPVYAMATERVVWGNVTKVESVRETYTVKPAVACDVTKPARSQGLVELLSWDLQTQCATRETSQVTGYRVEYRWDGRTYTQTMDEHPGTRIPLLLKLR